MAAGIQAQIRADPPDTTAIVQVHPCERWEPQMHDLIYALELQRPRCPELRTRASARKRALRIRDYSVN